MSRDNGLVVDLFYEKKAPYEFTGTVKEVVFDLKPAAAKKISSNEDDRALHAAEHHAHVAAGAAA